MIHRCTPNKKNIMVRNVCKILKKLIKHHDFPEEGTLSLTRLKVVNKVVTNNQVVVANVLNMYVKM